MGKLALPYGSAVCQVCCLLSKSATTNKRRTRIRVCDWIGLEYSG